MPGIDGWQFLSLSEKYLEKKKTSIYIVSSSIDHQDIENAKKNILISGYISKPLNEETLQNIANGKFEDYT